MGASDVAAGAGAGAAAGAFGGPVGIAVGAGIGAIGSLFGAKKQSNAAVKGAQIQSDAALQAAKLQKDSNDQAQATLRAQQAQDLAIANSTQQANYNQWRSREQRMSDFGSALGLSPRNIPDYQPIPGASGAAPSGQAPAASASGAWTPDFIRQQLQQTGQDPSDQNVQYFLGKENELKAREAELKQPGYALWRVRDPNSGKSGAAMPTPYANSLATMNTPQSPLVLTPALQQPNSFAQYMSR